MRRFSLSLLLLFLVSLCRAQYLGNVGVVTEQQQLATNQACTGANQFFKINNLGQMQHYLTASSLSSSVIEFQAIIQGIDASGTVVNISDPLMIAGTVRGTGYYPQLQVKVFCQPNSGAATYTLTYSGSPITDSNSNGSYVLAQTDKIVYNGATEAASASFQFQTPFASSGGAILFQYSAAGAGGSLTVSCQSAGLQTETIWSSPLANTTALQTLIVPSFVCENLILAYNNNGTVGTIFAEYRFSPPGTASPGQQYSHITGTTATAVKGTFGYLHTLSVNTGAAGTISLFDLAAANCTGTPSTNTVAVITATATTLQTFTYDTNFVNGICVKASAAMDFTASYQ